MADDRHARISEEAYRLWKAEGEPHGRDREHWEQAERAFAGEGPVADEADPQLGDDAAATSETGTDAMESDAAATAPEATDASTTHTALDEPASAPTPAPAPTAGTPATKPAAKKPAATRRKRTT